MEAERQRRNQAWKENLGRGWGEGSMGAELMGMKYVTVVFLSHTASGVGGVAQLLGKLGKGS